MLDANQPSLESSLDVRIVWSLFTHMCLGEIIPVLQHLAGLAT